MKIAFTKKLRAYKILGMLAAILFRVSCFLASYQNLKIKMQEAVILPVNLCGCETYSFTQR